MIRYGQDTSGIRHVKPTDHFACLVAKRYNAGVLDSFIDHLGGIEKQRIIKRLRSPEAYERLRENVKGPEDLERALDRAEKMAELHFALESHEREHEKMKAIIERAMREQGIERVVDSVLELSDELRSAVADGRFQLEVSPHAETHEDTLMIVPEGNVQERVPVTMSLADVCVSQLTKNA